MGCHFCQDELFAVFAILTSARYVPMFIRRLWAKRHVKPICHHDVHHEHKEGPTTW